MSVNRVERAFAAAAAEGRAALVVFVTAGDPDIDTTERLVPLLHSAGADVVELGFPHSDPIGEGATIQLSSMRALARGVTLPRILESVKRARAETDGAIVLMGYLNNVLAYGERSLARDAAAAGADGLIVADTPYDAVPDLDVACEASDLARILLVSPTTPPERVCAIATHSRGFVYCVAVTGVTGARRELPDDLAHAVARIKRITDTPVAVGFGISTPEHAVEVARIADGVIVGSALVARIGAADSPEAAADAATAFVRSLRDAIDSAGR